MTAHLVSWSVLGYEAVSIMPIFSKGLYSAPDGPQEANPSGAQLKRPGMSPRLWLDVWSEGHRESFVVSLDYCSCETECEIVYIASLLSKFTGMAPTVCIKANLNYNLKMPLSLSLWGWSGKYRQTAKAESLSR